MKLKWLENLIVISYKVFNTCILLILFLSDARGLFKSASDIIRSKTIRG
ncbi:hypothetical protein FB99_18880 [Pantoea agglomerans]|nr:hypothetical protein FB99_18880 [Pantoea agglomerans]